MGPTIAWTKSRPNPRQSVCRMTEIGYSRTLDVDRLDKKGARVGRLEVQRAKQCAGAPKASVAPRNGAAQQGFQTGIVLRGPVKQINEGLGLFAVEHGLLGDLVGAVENEVGQRFVAQLGCLPQNGDLTRGYAQDELSVVGRTVDHRRDLQWLALRLHVVGELKLTGFCK